MGLRQIEIADLRELKGPQIGLTGSPMLLKSGTILLLKLIQLPGKLHHNSVPRASGERSTDWGSLRAFTIARRQDKDPVGIGRKFDLSLGWQKARQFTDHRVILGPLSLLDPNERLDAEDSQGLLSFGLKQLEDLLGRHPGRTGNEITTNPPPLGIEKLEVAGPASREPANVERRARTIPGSMSLEKGESPLTCLRRFPQDPVAVLAHHGDAIEHNGLTGGENCDLPFLIEFLRQVKVDVAGSHTSIIDRRGVSRRPQGGCRAC
jgi:hypothetical protein